MAASMWKKFTTFTTSVTEFFSNSTKRRRDGAEERHVNGNLKERPSTVSKFDLPEDFETEERPYKKFKETQPSQTALRPVCSNRMDEKARKPNGHVPGSSHRNYVVSARKPISTIINGEPLSSDPAHRSFGSFSGHQSSGVDASRRSAVNASSRPGTSFGSQFGPSSSVASVRKQAVKKENEEIRYVETTTTNSGFKVPHTSPPPSRQNYTPSMSSTQSSAKVPFYRDITGKQPRNAVELVRYQEQIGKDFCAARFATPSVPKQNTNKTLTNGVHHKGLSGSNNSLSSSSSANAVTRTLLDDNFSRITKERISQKSQTQPDMKTQPTKTPVPRQSPRKVVDVITLDDEESVKVLEPKSPLAPYLAQIVNISKKREKELLRVARDHVKTGSPILDDPRNYAESHEQEWRHRDLGRNLDDTLERVIERVKHLPSPSIDIDFVDLSDEEERMVTRAFGAGAPTDVLSDKFRLQVTRKDIATLKGQNWLNDEVCNFFLEMIVDRATRHSKTYPKVYTYNTFFYTTLLNKGYDSVKRWTKKVDIFDHDLLLVPVHLGSHWCLAVIDMIQQQIRYYDSLGKANHHCVQTLMNYLEREKQDKQKQSLDSHHWRRWFSAEEREKPIPLQNNGSDCGVFMLKFADFSARKRDINVGTFTHEDMPYFRRRICWEILQQKLMGT